MACQGRTAQFLEVTTHLFAGVAPDQTTLLAQLLKRDVLDGETDVLKALPELEEFATAPSKIQKDEGEAH